MPSSSFLYLMYLLFGLLNLPSPSHADPGPVDDLCIADLTALRTAAGFPCKPASQVTANDFVFDGLMKQGNTSNIFGSFTTHGSVDEFPGLNTLGVSVNRLDFAPGGINPPHTHPRATELAAVIIGRLLVGIVTSDNKLFSRVVEKGEMFVVPRGLMHFQYNVGQGKARALAFFDSQRPGTLNVATTLFGSTPEVPDQLLAKVFQISEANVRSSKGKLMGA